MKTGPKIKILIADDHPAFREGLTAILDRQPDLLVIGEAGDGEAALEMVRKCRPDVVLTDLQMPKANGLQAITGILQEFPETGVIVLTAFDGDEDIYRALQAGARAYLLKDMGKEEYLEAIRSVHAGKRWIPPAVAARLADRINRNDLTGREMAVLQLLVQGKSNKEISAALSISEETAKTHLQGVFAKLGVKDRTQAAVAALRRGIVHLE